MLLHARPGVPVPPPYLLKDFTNKEMLTEGAAVGVEFFQYDHWVLHHFLGQDAMKTLIPEKEGGEATV